MNLVKTNGKRNRPKSGMYVGAILLKTTSQFIFYHYYHFMCMYTFAPNASTKNWRFCMWSDCIAKFLSSMDDPGELTFWRLDLTGLNLSVQTWPATFGTYQNAETKKKNTSSKPIESKHSSRFWENMFNHCEEVQLKQQISSHLGTRGFATARCKRCKLSLMIISSQGSQLTWMCSRWLEKNTTK